MNLWWWWWPGDGGGCCGLWGKGLGWELRRLVYGLGVDLVRVADVCSLLILGWHGRAGGLFFNTRTA